MLLIGILTFFTLFNSMTLKLLFIMLLSPLLSMVERNTEDGLEWFEITQCEAQKQFLIHSRNRW